MNEKNIEQLMSVPAAPVDSERALARIRERIERERISPPSIATPARTRSEGSFVSIWVKGLAAAASVALVAVLLTASGLAETIVTIFEPKQVVAVPITTGDLMSTAGFARYG